MPLATPGRWLGRRSRGCCPKRHRCISEGRAVFASLCCMNTCPLAALKSFMSVQLSSDLSEQRSKNGVVRSCKVCTMTMHYVTTIALQYMVDLYGLSLDLVRLHRTSLHSRSPTVGSKAPGPVIRIDATANFGSHSGPMAWTPEMRFQAPHG